MRRKVCVAHVDSEVFGPPKLRGKGDDGKASGKNGKVRKDKGYGGFKPQGKGKGDRPPMAQVVVGYPLRLEPTWNLIWIEQVVSRSV